MERHVICVWSYNALLRSLQKELASLPFPLYTDGQKEALRLVSEIILDEEVDDIGDGRIFSHMELYLEAMNDVGCDVAPILGFFDMLACGTKVEKALSMAQFPDEVTEYGLVTAEMLKKPLNQRAAALFYEGECYIPDRFLFQLDSIDQDGLYSRFLDYLERHIEGLKRPGFSAAGRLVEVLCGDCPTLNKEAETVSEVVMRSRVDLWNAICRGLAVLSPGETPIERRSKLYVVP